jgi:NADPH-dependent 2,4-dienoyl-CoA reductase/sulfur reductase-like enzyme
MPERLIVVGGVAAGMSAAAKARRTNKQLDIIVYEQSGFVSYGSCGFPYFIKGEIPQINDVIVRTPAQFAAQGITAHVKHQVLEIDSAAQTVVVRNLDTGHEFTDQWDRLILTTGGASARPALAGLQLPGIFTLRTVEDAVAIRQWIDEHRPERGVIVGGGYIGLELAEALAAHHMHITLLEATGQVLPTLDAEMAAHIQAELTAQGVDVRLDCAVEAFAGSERVREVLAGGQHIAADIVIVSVGVKPNVGLARAAGIALGPTGAVAVDDHQRTNITGIWAAGDVAEAQHLVMGRPAYVPLGSTANKQGKVAGANAAGGDERFGGIVGTSVVLRVLGFRNCALVPKGITPPALWQRPIRAHTICRGTSLFMSSLYSSRTHTSFWVARLLAAKVYPSGSIRWQRHCMRAGQRSSWLSWI